MNGVERNSGPCRALPNSERERVESRGEPKRGEQRSEAHRRRFRRSRLCVEIGAVGLIGYPDLMLATRQSCRGKSRWSRRGSVVRRCCCVADERQQQGARGRRDVVGSSSSCCRSIVIASDVLRRRDLTVYSRSSFDGGRGLFSQWCSAVRER